MNSLTYRHPTPNERLYLNQVFKERTRIMRSAYQTFTVLTILSVILAVFIVDSFPAGIAMILGTVLCLLSAWLFYTLSKSKVEHNDCIVAIKGQYRMELIGSGRTMRSVYFIGDVTFQMPGHWFKHLQYGDRVEAEAYFYNADHLRIKGLVYDHCILVSLNNRYYVEREVPLGLLELKTNLSLLMSVIVLIFTFLPMILTAPVHSPGAIIQKYRYELMPVQEFQRIPDFYSNPNRIRTKVKIKITRAALAPAGKDLYYLYEPVPGDRENLAGLVRNIYNEKENRRINLFKEFTGTPNYKLTIEETWRNFEVFADNPAYDIMKRKFLSEGRAFLRNNDLDEENIIAHYNQFEIMADEYRKEFLNGEQEKIDQLLQERKHMLQRKLPDLYSSLLFKRRTLLLKEIHEYHYPSFVADLAQSIGSSGNSVMIRKKIQGLLTPIHANSAEAYLIDPEYESIDTIVLTRWLFLSGLGLGLGLILLVRGVAISDRNRNIREAIERMYI